MCPRQEPEQNARNSLVSMQACIGNLPCDDRGVKLCLTAMTWMIGFSWDCNRLSLTLRYPSILPWSHFRCYFSCFEKYWEKGRIAFYWDALYSFQSPVHACLLCIRTFMLHRKQSIKYNTTLFLLYVTVKNIVHILYNHYLWFHLTKWNFGRCRIHFSPITFHPNDNPLAIDMCDRN